MYSEQLYSSSVAEKSSQCEGSGETTEPDVGGEGLDVDEMVEFGSLFAFTCFSSSLRVTNLSHLARFISNPQEVLSVSNGEM